MPFEQPIDKNGLRFYERVERELEQLRQSSNYREIPHDKTIVDSHLIDFTSNDYLGIARRSDWQEDFLSTCNTQELLMTSAASRLLADNQTAYQQLEKLLAELYGRPALLFNSGYHANTGIISALADNRTLILADKLVHASIIDGIMLSKAKFARFRHNDIQHLERLIEKESSNFETIMVVVESVYSMNGDCAPIDCLIDIKHANPKVILYVDEAHAFGCEGPAGLGLCAASKSPSEIDVIVGTLGKAAASQGAFTITNFAINQYLTNRSRSLIFSTAIPPISAKWSKYVIERMVAMDSERQHLHALAKAMNNGLSSINNSPCSTTAIQPFIVGNSSDTLTLSAALKTDGIKVLPIRTPTVPPNTERLRFSLSAAHTIDDVTSAIESLKHHYLALNSPEQK